MKIIHFVYADKVSGLEVLSMNILSELSSENEVYYAAPEGDGLKVAESMGIGVIPCRTSDFRDIKRVVKEYMPDVVHAHDPHVSLNCALAGVKFVAHLHSNCAWLGKLCPNSLGLLFAVMRAKKVICVSESIVDEFLFSSIMRKKAVVLHNYVDRDIVMKKAMVRTEKSYDISSVARMIVHKNPYFFVDFIEKLKSLKNDVSAVMIGDGEIFEDVKAYIKSRDLDNTIDLRGYDSNPFPVVKASKIGVLTSDIEGFGLVAVEAMALSKPFLTRPAGGLPLIVNESCGGLFETPEDMAQEAYKLLTDEVYYEEKSKAALERSALFTDKARYISRLLDIYTE
ncbi:MAG: glycosyltransferase family 4 protein [Clostridia bacterium]|nr:glycosyltransferase family 4 protein [Clostridia bacterium]